jgi:hypothetical protein
MDWEGRRGFGGRVFLAARSGREGSRRNDGGTRRLDGSTPDDLPLSGFRQPLAKSAMMA